MLKVIVSGLVFSFSLSSMAAPPKRADRKIASAEIKCAENPSDGPGIDPDFVIKQVQAQSTCYHASEIVENCAAGSSMDSPMTGAAIAVCDKLAGKLSKPDAALKKTMLARCEKVCDPKNDGTLCISQQAFCRLDVSQFLNSVNNKIN